MQWADQAHGVDSINVCTEEVSETKWQREDRPACWVDFLKETRMTASLHTDVSSYRTCTIT